MTMPPIPDFTAWFNEADPRDAEPCAISGVECACGGIDNDCDLCFGDGVVTDWRMRDLELI